MPRSIVVKEEEIRKFYDDNTAQFSSMSYDAAKPRITQYLTGEMRKQKYQEALAELKTEYIVEVLTPDTTDAAED
jgi:transposase InsO family protein